MNRQFPFNPKNAFLRICTIKISSGDPKALSREFGVACNLTRRVIDRGNSDSLKLGLKVNAQILSAEIREAGAWHSLTYSLS
jgi:hypothetical protein